jgi:ATP-dependent helicase/nuclease subunit A
MPLNPEQMKAVEHNGGVLLKAGAGSGKTTVLIEHILYLTQNKLNDLSHFPIEEHGSELKKFFSEIVMMTFTNKAAGELSIRLNKKFKAKLEEDNSWQLAIDNLNYMSVGTIHGFCYKLIKNGHFPQINPEVGIIDETQFKSHMEQLFLNWLELQESSDVIELIRSQPKNVLKAVTTIFEDPGLRLQWKKGITEESFEKVIKDIYDLSDANGLFDNKVQSEHPALSGKAKEFFINWNEFKLEPPKDEQSYKAFAQFFESFPRLPQKRGKIKETPEISEYIDKLKEFKEIFYKDNMESFVEYFQSKDIVSSWYKKLEELFDFIENHYDEVEGFTFSDLEYYVLDGLSDPKVTSAISDTYRYFIIDEFQDTSYVQFDIISKLIQNDFNRLFCVGDEKQAIYGFRGGELGVFWDCEKKVPQTLMMTNNYRSLPEVVRFNNHLFDHLFKLGLGYEGVDKHSVEVVHQRIDPNLTFDEKGEMTCLNRAVEMEEIPREKLKTAEKNYLEANSIIDILKKEEKQTAILYKNLGPSAALIDRLLEEGMSFTAQIKIPYLEEPIIGLFYHILEGKFNKSEKSDEFRLLVLNSYLKILEINKKIAQPEVDNLFAEIKTYGVKWAFNRFLFDLGIANSNFKNNINYLHNLIDTSIDLEEVFIKLQRSEVKFTSHLQFGDSPENIIIMTAHASKGLEFPHVILGGIHHNQSRSQGKPIIGKFPGSFKWYKSGSSKKSLKTPKFIYEELFDKRKEFSESKRLFYVANTRAEQKITWFDYAPTKGAASEKGSWGQGLVRWKELEKQMHQTIELDEVKITDIRKTLEGVILDKPLFHRKNLGIEKRQGQNQLLVMSDLSVTRLATLSQCPRKFYLSQILKFSDEQVEQINQIMGIESNNTFTGSGSSAARGTFVHDLISQSIINGVIPREYFDDSKTKPIHWIMEQMNELNKTHELISEVGIKFSFFGHVISGIPDLVALHDSNAQVWDFKTGKPNELKDKSYWFQLMSYGLALYELGRVEKSQNIETSAELRRC